MLTHLQVELYVYIFVSVWGKGWEGDGKLWMMRIWNEYEGVHGQTVRAEVNRCVCTKYIRRYVYVY